MEKIHIDSIYFNKLKGLKDVKIEFTKPLTAIMGVNGSGKTTVIHALACVYRPDNDGNGENHHFPEFFVPNTDSLWRGSEFHVVNKIETDNNWIIQSSSKYTKSSDRWTPRYDSRPKRNVYYIGVDTCLPEIEKRNTISRIQYTSRDRLDKMSKKMIEVASYVLNKNYSTLVENVYHNRHFLGVTTKSGLRYSSLSMGTGEQRTFKILEKVMNAEAYSLILIDEIDLLLHVSALKRLINELYNIAISKHLQIVFTTHSLEILRMKDHVGIQYINAVTKPDGNEFFYVLDKPNDDIIRDLTGSSQRPIKVYVEDKLSKAIVTEILKKYNILRKTTVITYGSAQNAFTLAAGEILSGRKPSNLLIVLDGDVFAAPEEKYEQIKKVITGTETNAEEKRNQALAYISQFNLYKQNFPEKFIFDLLLTTHKENEIIKVAREIQAVSDSHQYIGYICEQLQESVELIMPSIIGMIESKKEWQEYIAPVENWIKDHKDV